MCVIDVNVCVCQAYNKLTSYLLTYFWSLSLSKIWLESRLSCLSWIVIYRHL